MQWPMVAQGREVNEEKIRWLSGWIGTHPHWSRRQLAGELCTLWKVLRHLRLPPLHALHYASPFVPHYDASFRSRLAG